MDELTNIAAAVADPVRREILVMLGHTPLTAGEIAARFSISRPAVSRHLRVLRESGLVRDEQHGRHRRYTLVRFPLGRLTEWLLQFEVRQAPAWSRQLAALDTEVHRARRERGRSEPAGNPSAARQKDTA
ncbi:ArsR/SmtB family transcription factor [Streptomyces sp. NPDC059861]|uniref:ArsR/SmtB family transcription factor n=1 Tax=Streptomyces sp. NPDC059861 TaxID=3346974 RepID=UPI0036633AF3